MEVLHFVRSLMEGSSPVDHMKLKKQSFELLITPRLTNLDLSIGQLNDVPYIINLASLRCLVRHFINFSIHDYKIMQSC